ncbi:ABC transporter ATP-binding protein [Virgibacillus ainsalahensis]
MIVSSDIREAGYSKDSPVLKNIQFSIESGELVGLIGPNGAGKSSTIKSLLGIINHIDGHIEVEDYAYIPERPIFYHGLTLMEHFYFLCSTLEADEKQFMSRVHTLLKEFDLEEVANHYPDSFSKGMQQKAMIMLAFLQQPSLHIIDEPFMGLDPKVVKKLLHMIQKEKERGAGILMSTHVLDTAEKICDRFLLISHGSLIAEGTLDDIREQSGLQEGSLFDCFDVLTERDTYDR